MSDRRAVLIDRPDTRPDRGGAEPFFARRFGAGDRETRAVLHDLVQALVRAGIGDDDVSNAELVLAEVLNNVAEHAYADGAGPVEMTVGLDSGSFYCEVADCGQPMPADAPPDPAFPVIAPPDHLPEGGFGWHIIRCLTSELSYRRDQGWNRLSIRMPWTGMA